MVELLVALAIIAVLAALVWPGLARSREAAWRVQCVSNLRQLGLAGQMYWDENGGEAFRYGGAATNGGQLYWFGWFGKGAEGERAFDRDQGALRPYIGGARVEICPALRRAISDFKSKAVGASNGYGYNLQLSAPAGRPPVNVGQLRRPSGVVFLADAAQVNDFQPPASRDHPMLEEFYYVSTNETTAHFRHGERANGVWCDGHVAPEAMAPGTLDRRLPRHHVGRLRDEVLADDR